METLRELTIREATNLKQHATEVEKEKLTKKFFEPDNISRCIYGQMTGDCDSSRAVKLAKLCIGKVSVAGLESKRISQTKPRSAYARYSPLEAYIYQYRGSGEKIIDFIKGETETLDL